MTFPNTNTLYFIKAKTVLIFLILCFSVLLVPYMIRFHPYQSQKHAISDLVKFFGVFDIFCSFPEHVKYEGFANVL